MPLEPGEALWPELVEEQRRRAEAAEAAAAAAAAGEGAAAGGGAAGAEQEEGVGDLEAVDTTAQVREGVDVGERMWVHG